MTVIPSPLSVVAEFRDIVFYVVDHDEIQPAVTIVVYEAGRHAPQDAVQTGLAADFGKGAVPVIQKEFQAAVLRDEHVRPAVVVDIGDSNTRAVTRDVQAGARAHVRKAPVRPLAEETIP